MTVLKKICANYTGRVGLSPNQGTTRTWNSRSFGTPAFLNIVSPFRHAKIPSLRQGRPGDTRYHQSQANYFTWPLPAFVSLSRWLSVENGTIEKQFLRQTNASFQSIWKLRSIFYPNKHSTHYLQARSIYLDFCYWIKHKILVHISGFFFKGENTRHWLSKISPCHILASRLKRTSHIAWFSKSTRETLPKLRTNQGSCYLVSAIRLSESVKYNRPATYTAWFHCRL